MAMTNAEWMIKSGYKFSDLELEDRGSEFKIYLKDNAIGQYPQGFTMYEAAMKWLDMEHKEPILDDAEKKYLSAVIKPFRNDVKYIIKIESIYRLPDDGAEYIKICMCSDEEINLPYFRYGTMYKGMEPNRRYTLEELGL